MVKITVQTSDANDSTLYNMDFVMDCGEDLVIVESLL